MRLWILLPSLAFTLFFCFCGIAPAQSTFVKTFGLSGEDQGHSVIRCTNGDLLVSGLTKSIGAGDFDLYVMRLDPVGNQIWARVLGSSSLEEGYGVDVHENIDGTIIVGAGTLGLGAAGRDNLLVKLSAVGAVVWERRVGAANAQQCMDVEQLMDGNYLMTGSDANGGNAIDYWIGKFDPSGNAIWGTAFYGGAHEFAFESVELSDSSIIVVGGTQSFGAGGGAFGVVRVNSSGNAIWSRIWDSPGREGYYHVKLAADGNLLITGRTTGFGAGLTDGVITKADINGNIVWTKAYGTTADDHIIAIQPLADSGMVVLGQTNSTIGFGNDDVYLMRLDKSGNIVWCNAFGNSSYQGGVQTNYYPPDGQTLIVSPGESGFTFVCSSDTTAGGREILLVRTDALGTTDCYTKPISLTVTNYSLNVLGSTFQQRSEIVVNSVTSTTQTFSFNSETKCSGGPCIDSAVVIPSTNLVCGNDSIFLGNFSVGFGPWQWFDNGVPFSTQVNPYWSTTVNGTHIIRLIAGVGLCADTMDIVVERFDSIVADAGIGPLLMCPGDSVQIGGSPTVSGGTGPINISWTPGATVDNPVGANPMAFPANTTWYWLQVVDSVGCQDDDSIQVVVTSPPAADAGGGAGATYSFCIEDSAQLGGAPTGSGGTGTLAYQWTPASGLSGTTITNPWASPSTTTTYYLTVTDSLGCIGTDSVRVNIWQKPVIDTTSLQWASATCDSINGFIQGITATGTPTLGYQWYLGSSAYSTTQNITGLNVGTYKLVVTDGNGCADSVQFTIGQLGKPQLGTLSTLPNTCDSVNGSAWISGVNGGSPPYTYQWTDGSNNLGTDTVIIPVDSGLYYVTASDTNGCTLDTSVLVGRMPLPYVAANFDSASTWVNTPVSKNLYPNDTGLVSTITIVIPPISGTATVDNAGNMTYTPNQNYVGYDYFYYIICDPTCPYECDTAQVLIHVKDQIPLYIPNGFSPNGDGYNDQFVIIGLAFYPENTIAIYNRWGDKVYEANPYKSDWDGMNSKSGKAVTDGTYYYILKLTPSSETMKGPIELRR